MNQSPNGLSISRPDRLGQRGRFTGERVKALRPETYRRAVELLAEPREQVPYDHICRLLRVSEHTLKAIEKAESASIAERKQALLAKALRIAHKAADRIEDQIQGANITAATVAFGVATEKLLLLAGDHTTHLQVSIEPGPNLYEQLAHLRASLSSSTSNNPVTSQPLAARPALPNGETISDSGR